MTLIRMEDAVIVFEGMRKERRYPEWRRALREAIAVLRSLPAVDGVVVPRDRVLQAADALKVFTGHDSHANLCHRYGKEWWKAVNVIEESLRAALTAAPKGEA